MAINIGTDIFQGKPPPYLQIFLFFSFLIFLVCEAMFELKNVNDNDGDDEKFVWF